jgi:uncharacterized delta-60 repeat protein
VEENTRRILIAVVLIFTLFASAGCNDVEPTSPETVCSTGYVDESFGVGGIAITDLGGDADVLHAIAVQPDGKIVAIGQVWDGEYWEFGLARYNTDGTLDAAFGEESGDARTGKVRISIAPYDDYPFAVAIQDDGKILVGGNACTVDNATSDFALVRFNADGTPDTGFGDQGVVKTNVGSSNDVACTLTVLKNGKVLLAGYSWNGSVRELALVRYNEDGSLDDTFGEISGVARSGIVTTPVGSLSMINSVGLFYEKIMAVGSFVNGIYYDSLLARFNADGGLDTHFGSDGVVVNPVATASDEAGAVAIQADGKIVVAGIAADVGFDDQIDLTRYNPDGSLDSSFGSGGVVRTEIGEYSYTRAVVIQDDGKIVVTGWAGIETRTAIDNCFVLMRFDNDGSLDATLGLNGIVVTRIGDNSMAEAVAILEDGKIVVAGSSSSPSTNSDFTLVRYE